MAKRIGIRSLAGCLIVALMVSALASTFLIGSPSGELGKQSVAIKSNNSQSVINASEPCEEKEAKDSFEECSQLAELPFSNETVFARLIANSLRLENHSVSSFANTTNLPLYLAKCSFLI
jgi:hypothetical protein